MFFAVAAATTDIQLLLTDTRKITLPFLSAEIPILFFYRFTPIIIFLFHINLFINLYLYAREYIPWLEDANNKPSYLTTLFFNYSFINNNGKLGFSGYSMLTVILYSVLPLITLIWIALMFLPYRNEGLTLYHEIVITLDAILSVIFFRAIKILLLKQQKEIKSEILIIAVVAIAFIGMLSDILYCFHKNPFPNQRTEDNWFDNNIFNRNIKVVNKTIVEKESRDTSINFDLSNGKTREDALAKLAERLDLRNRNLSYADFSNSKFINADLDNANLQEADLVDANLQGADLYKANLEGANLWDANLEGADLWDANLEGANLSGATLQGTHLFEVNLQGADLSGATLRGADLSEVNLNCSIIDNATNFEGIYFYDINKLFKSNEYSQIDNETAELCKSFDNKSIIKLLVDNKKPTLFLDINKKLACKNPGMAKSLSDRYFNVILDNGTKVSFRNVIVNHIKDNCTQFLQYTE